MPPKKKQEQIDLTTLPECKSINIFLYCKGKEERAKKILNKIDTKYNKILFHINKTQVLDYAKEKGIYIDPQTLTDKQKKDAKFMESVCTEMTPQVLAKATDAYINNQNVKIRLEKKAQLAKPQAQQDKTKKFDCMYIFDDFPTQAVDFEAHAVANQGIKFIFVIQPKISWASAPQEPDPAQPDEQGNEQVDEQYQQYKKLKQAQNYTPQDQQREKTIQQKIQNLKNARRNSATTSQFRNTVIDIIKCTIDPYTEQANIQQASQLILTRSKQLFDEEIQFKAWRKDKQAEKLPQKQQKQKVEQKKQAKQIQSGDKIIETLKKLLSNFEQVSAVEKSHEKHIDFDDFDFNGPQSQQQNFIDTHKTLQNDLQTEFLRFNEKTKRKERDFVKQLLANMKYPGVDRFMIPQLAPKSEGLRKLYRSTFGQFLPQKMNFNEFERQNNILFLESTAKQADEERTYDFSNRIYEQQHTKQSLARQLNKALLYDQSTVTLKYNENNDKLYICLLYKNPARRMNKKVWESNWKVLPNFQSWLKYFKENQNNLNNTQYYDIDYQSIGNIEEQANVFSVKENGVIVRKKLSFAGKQIKTLYCLPGHNTGDLIFGLRNANNHCQFYAQNQIVHITVTQMNVNEQQKQKSTFLTFKDQTILQFKQNGDIIIRKPNQQTRLITCDGYTVIYKNNKQRQILHPNGSVSYPQIKYTNEQGKGLKQDKLHTVPTLKRLSEQGHLITRRDDHTVIVQQNNKKWIKFQDNTQYLLQNNQTIIQKQDYPKIIIQNSNNTIKVSYNGVQINSNKNGEQYQFTFDFVRIASCNKSRIICNKNNVQIYDGKTESFYTCNLQDKVISKEWDNQFISVGFEKSLYKRNDGKTVDPQEDQQNYNEEDVIRSDYVEPRLFIINNDNTGIQLFSEGQLKQGYLQNFNVGDNREVEIQNFARSQLRTLPHSQQPYNTLIYGVIPIPPNEKLNHRIIKSTTVNLDIFNNQSQAKQHKANNKTALQVRSLVQYKPLTAQDRQTIANIYKQQNQWQTKSERQENQYGHKPRNDQSTLDRFQSKKKVIEYRRLKEQQIQSQNMIDQAIELYNKETQSRLKKMENQKRQAQLKRRLSKKKSYVSQYQWKEPKPVEIDENENHYNHDSHFYTSYFQTLEGRKALSQMPDWVFKPKQNKKTHELDPQIREQLNATLNKTKKDEQSMNRTNQKQQASQSEKNQRYDTVQVEVKPSPQIYIKPSIFTQRDIDQQRFAFETQKKAYDYHERKRKDYDLYGRQRKEKVQVPSLMRTQPMSQLNQKYLVTQAPVDKKVKISSMKNKLTSSASNMTQMRKEGPHTNLMRTIDKGNDYSKLLEKRTMMVQADLNDRLQRDILINPIEANFGIVKEGGNYELKIQIKNQDVLSQRIQLKKPNSIFCKVQMSEMGPIALGMTRKVKVLLKAAPEIAGKFNDEFCIVSKHQVYHIPISAQILGKTQFEATGSVLNKTVREFQEIGKKKREELPPIKSP